MTLALQWLRTEVLPRLRAFGVSRALQAAFAFLCATAGDADFAPLGPAAVAGAWLMGAAPYPALLGAALGALIAGHYASLAASALYVGAGLLFSLWRGHLYRAEKLALLALVHLLLLPFFHGESAESCLVGAAELVLACLAAVGIFRGGTALTAFLHGRRLRGSDQAMLLVFAAIFAMALPSFTFILPGESPFGTEVTLRFGAALAAFAALAAVRIRGMEGVAAAVLLGAACLVAGADIAYTGALSLAALAAAFLQRGGKWALAGGFLAAWAAAAAAFRLPATALIEAAAGAIGFVALPHSVRQRMLGYSKGQERSAAERTLAVTRTQLRGTAEVIRAVSDLFPPGGDDSAAFTHRQLRGVSGVIERLAEDGPPSQRRFDVRVGAAGCPKAGNAETGDSMAMRSVGGGLLLILSDGMGTGPCARRESSAACAIFGDLLSVGFAAEEAQECVNRLLMLKGEDEMYATLDALLINLSSGSARFIKYGAPPAYILRGGRIHTVYAEALPIGILPEAEPAVHEFSLRRGDAVVLMTDGLFDALGTELFAALIERVGGANTADDAAESLLAAGRERSGADDMSVFVARVC